MELLVWSLLCRYSVRYGCHDCGRPCVWRFLREKYNIAIPEHVANQADFDESKLPSFGTIVGIIMIPLVLIILDSLAGEVSDWHR